jgi:hypothetical protein
MSGLPATTNAMMVTPECAAMAVVPAVAVIPIATVRVVAPTVAVVSVHVIAAIVPVITAIVTVIAAIVAMIAVTLVPILIVPVAIAGVVRGHLRQNRRAYAYRAGNQNGCRNSRNFHVVLSCGVGA